jgi:glucose/arabinose dehydrogenase
MPLNALAALLLAAVGAAPAAKPATLAAGMKNPESVAIGPDGKPYVTVIGEFDKPGDGSVVRIEDGKAVPFAEGLDDPKGLVFFKDAFYVADRDKVLRIDAKTGKAAVYAGPEAFPAKPQFLNDVEVDAKGVLYVSDSGDLKGGAGAVYRIDLKRKVTTFVDASHPAIKTPNGLALDGAHFLLVADFTTGRLHRFRLADGAATLVAEGFGGGDGVVFDKYGRLFVTDWKGGRAFTIRRPGESPVLLTGELQAAADCCLDAAGKNLLIPDMKAGTLVAVAIEPAAVAVDTTPMPLVAEPAFPKLKWTGWKPLDDAERPTPLRPLVLTHAGDGSNRIFLATQQGVVHVFPADPAVTATKVFLDLTERVVYADKTNEEGLLGLAFHPNYKENGQFFVFYTVRDAKLTNVLVRFRASKDDPDRADPASGEELLRIERPFWNHDGGTLAFGPDGMLYVALGDGGKADDPFDNGQNLNSLLGKVLRIDVDRRDAGKAYAVPADNPFVNRKDARPEIWCYGLRNPWRMAFDRKTGKLWCADVGQNLYEEINILTAGGNFGWARREGLHPFSDKGVDVNDRMVEPIWEYHHDVGKSITGGHVYRGKRLPELEGHYLYADYITGLLWALKYDEAAGRVTANRRMGGEQKFQVVSYGEDEAGEVYFLVVSPNGQGVYRFARAGR